MPTPKKLTRREMLKQGSLAVASMALARGTDAKSPQRGGDDFKYASGGTKAMTGNYPDPFVGLEPDCTLTCAQTLGPCFADVDKVRRDVTEGKVGLPMRLAFRLLEASTCEPVEKANVEIWEADVDGVYSADTPAAMCHTGHPDVAKETFLRGIQFTDANGRADFDTVYPGWYPGRTPHIHVKIGLDGQELLVTQVYFDDALSAYIYEGHPDYDHRPNGYATNADDGVIDEDDLPAFLLKTRDNEDGSLLAYITLGLRSSTGEPLCGTSGPMRRSRRP